MKPAPIIEDFAFILVTWQTLVPLVAVVLTRLLVMARHRLVYDDAEPAARRAWRRRLVIVVVIVLALAGPAIHSSEAISVSNVETYMIVDCTGSMTVENYQGKGPDGVDQSASIRLDGMCTDIRAIRETFPDSRFSTIVLDNTAARELPLTHDTNTVDAWVGSFKQEVSDHTTGSPLGVALSVLRQMLAQARRSNPKDTRLVYIPSNGEVTDNGHGVQTADNTDISWQSLARFVDGGAVLGYGSTEGGKMCSYDGSPSAGKHTQFDYITDDRGGQPGMSKIDVDEPQKATKDLELPYCHRTDGSGNDPTNKFTNLDVEVATPDGRARTNA